MTIHVSNGHIFCNDVPKLGNQTWINSYSPPIKDNDRFFTNPRNKIDEINASVHTWLLTTNQLLMINIQFTWHEPIEVIVGEASNHDYKVTKGFLLVVRLTSIAYNS